MHQIIEVVDALPFRGGGVARHRPPPVVIVALDGEAMGAGETTITLVAAAIGNAVFDATGARLREVPFTPERVKAALAAAPS